MDENSLELKVVSNRHEMPRRRSAGALVADRHPALAQYLDSRWNAEAGIGELAGLTTFRGCGPSGGRP
jgi:hypothetical protein